ncbi:hypothetical protein AVDCRST_MAG94-5918 [uncultured Leptolyngbya sp.]|uniref:Uncharacterized protein n=1 Tax=uncultured Leptolyngbya sp. TaxID=332963 RepID=A0A6J4P612_9CYAN|nr:hypothetical protein AVDCRST_MAG94-5918 [uncultured Leptolyngbya sp.]
MGALEYIHPSSALKTCLAFNWRQSTNPDGSRQGMESVLLVS